MVKKMSENDKKQMKMIKNDENRRKIGKKKGADCLENACGRLATRLGVRRQSTDVGNA